MGGQFGVYGGALCDCASLHAGDALVRQVVWADDDECVLLVCAPPPEERLSRGGAASSADCLRMLHLQSGSLSDGGSSSRSVGTKSVRVGCIGLGFMLYMTDLSSDNLLSLPHWHLYLLPAVID